jgi:superfamily II DNA or RNA helicase
MPSLADLDAESAITLLRFVSEVPVDQRGFSLARFWSAVRLWQIKGGGKAQPGDIAVSLMLEGEGAHNFVLDGKRGKLRCTQHLRPCREMELATGALVSLAPVGADCADDPTVPPATTEALRAWARPLGLAPALALRWDLAFGVRNRSWSQDFRTLEQVLTEPVKALRRSYDPDPVELASRLRARAWRAVEHQRRASALPAAPAEDPSAQRAWTMLRPMLVADLPGWAPIEGWLKLLHDGRTVTMVNHAASAGETTSTQLSMASGQAVYTCRCGRRDGTCPDCQGLTLAVLERLANPRPEATPFWRLGEREADRSIAALRAWVEAPARADSARAGHLWALQSEGSGVWTVNLLISSERGGRPRAANPEDMEPVLRRIESDAELRLLELFRHQKSGGTAPSDELLLCLPGLPNLVDHRGEALRVDLLLPRLELRALDGGGVEPRLRLGEDLLDQNDVQRALSSTSNRLLQLSRPGRLSLARLAPGAKPALRALLTGEDIPADLAPSAVALLTALEGRLPLHLGAGLRGAQVEADPRPILRLQSLGPEGALAQLMVRPVAGGPLLEPGQPPVEAFGFTTEQGRIWANRDLSAELAAAEAARAKLPPLTPDQPLSNEVLILALESMRGEDGLPTVNPDDPGHLRVEWAGRARRLSRPAKPGDLKLSVSPARDWLGVTGELSLDGMSLNIDELLSAVLLGRRFVALQSGDLLRLSDELRAALAPAAAASGDRDGHRGLPSVAAAALQAAAEGGVQLDAGELQADWNRRIAALAASRGEAPVLPSGLHATLRPYQTQGMGWLLRMAAWAPGCVLADDMGLGKTLQAIGLLLHHANNGPQLVIAPTSVCDNWRDECARFGPSLRVRAYRDRNRQELLQDLDENDVLIASYDVVQRDIEALSEIGWATLVLDEAQAIKNAGTGRAKAVMQLPADFTLLLSGTPVENHLGELWSLLQRAVPGLLGGYEVFRERFQRPVEAHRDAERREALAALVRPFILRRKKADVAPELPPRIVTTERVPLSRIEGITYHRLREALAARVAGSGEGQRFEVLSAITRLRQLSNAVQLVDPESNVPSAKLDRAVELLSELWSEGQASLVFSQFTSLLKLLAPRLKEAGLPFLYLDGATPAAERSQLVRRFQGGEGAVFLLSLKAGGTGLNLTRASSVIHLDPWWNPAVEDQATDRAHRIGQKQPVTVVRLVAAGTIEEQILELHATKRELVDGVLSGADGGQSLSVRELCAMLTASPPSA